MKLEDQVPTLEQCKKLKELGVVIETELSWEIDTRELVYDCSDCPVPELYLPAPTVAELGVLLPAFIDSKDPNFKGIVGKSAKLFCYRTERPCFIVGYFDTESDEAWYRTDRDINNEAQARADMLIWLIQNGYIEAKELKL